MQVHERLRRERARGHARPNPISSKVHAAGSGTKVTPLAVVYDAPGVIGTNFNTAVLNASTVPERDWPANTLPLALAVNVDVTDIVEPIVVYTMVVTV